MTLLLVWQREPKLGDGCKVEWLFELTVVGCDVVPTVKKRESEVFLDKSTFCINPMSICPGKSSVGCGRNFGAAGGESAVAICIWVETVYLACGGAVVSMAYIGGAARALYPEACSLPDFMRRRFSGRAAASGRLAQGLAVTMNLFNMCVALAAEYTTFLELLRSYSGLPFRTALCLLIAMALATLAYTIAGGLFVSIMTDRLQAIAALSLVGVLLVFTAGVVPWDGLPPLSPELKGYTYSGYSSIVTMPLGLLVGGALFSEAMWQRVWAIEVRRAMTRAAWTAFGGGRGHFLLRRRGIPRVLVGQGNR